MSEDQSQQPKQAPVDESEQLLQSVIGDIKRGQKEKAKAKLKGLLEKKTEHQRSVSQLDVEIQQVLTDFKAGVL